MASPIVVMVSATVTPADFKASFFASFKSLGEKSYTGVMASTGLSYLSLIVSLGASGGLLLLA